MLFEGVTAGLACRIVGNCDLLSTIIIVSGACEFWRNQKAHRCLVYSHQPEVEERMQIGSEKQSVAGVFRFRPLVWDDISCLQDGIHLTPSDGASTLVGHKQAIAESRLPPTPHN